MNNLDQFYTEPKVASNCYDFMLETLPFWAGHHIFLEPSAGNGAFYKLLPPTRRIGIDLKPKAPGIRKHNFFKYSYGTCWRVIVIGNPPFGKNSSIAVKFFNHAASFLQVDVIAFIIPKTFRKNSIQNRLSMDFHLIGELNLPDNSFIKDGKPYNVPACFQVWERRLVKRTPIQVNLDNDWFEFVKKSDNPDLAVRRVGFTVGKCLADLKPCKEHSFYFLKLRKGINRRSFSAHINSIRQGPLLVAMAANTVGARSLSQGEFVEILRQYPFPA